MTSLHGYFTLRNQKGFQRQLESCRAPSAPSAPSLSSSGGRSWTKPSVISAAGPPIDINARDWLGRTVLHLACSALDPAALEYVKMLLAQPSINVNAQDTESHWTPLHRALYAGNIAACLLLLARSDVDISLKDFDGYTAFDLYNSTVEGTKPGPQGPTVLFTWGKNRNATLGLGDGDDRAHPEQVPLKRTDYNADSILTDRLQLVSVTEVAMARLHTTVLTSEKRSNLRVCGFGSGGRLGPGQHTQYNFVPLQQFDQSVTAVALGQDHTVAVNRAGDVLTWGLNRFSQLGYIIETPSGSRSEEPIQATPRKVAGALKKEVVLGVAACKTASACWTKDGVYTWGTNYGQLGYNKVSQPVQILPRKVTAFSQAVIDMAMTDNAMACLLESKDVICFWNDSHFKINFPMQRFPSEFSVYRPPQAISKPAIAKLTSSETTFAALSSLGDVFLFTANPTEPEAGHGKEKERAGVKPQLVWALRKQFSAVKDVAVGSDGSLILCTESGHVFVRSRNVKSGQGGLGKTFKFQRVPYLQRVVKVCANSTGALGALRVDAQPNTVVLEGNSVEEDLRAIQPYMLPVRKESHDPFKSLGGVPGSIDDPEDNDLDEDVADHSVGHDIRTIHHLIEILERDRLRREESGSGLFHGAFLAGADVVVQAGIDIPAHRTIILSRCVILQSVFSGHSIRESNFAIKFQPNNGTSRLIISGCHTLTILLLLEYLYTDDISAIWDRRIGLDIAARLTSFKTNPAQIKSELQNLSRALNLPALAQALNSPTKKLPAPTLAQDMKQLFFSVQGDTPHASMVTPDIVIALANKDVRCHSVILRARSPFFTSFFDDEDWTRNRWHSGSLRVNMKHLEWRPMVFVFTYIYCGSGEEMFDELDFIESIDELIDFIFLIMAAASELLLDNLVHICSAVILRYVNICNVCFIFADAVHYQATQLMNSLQGYMAQNLETLLENRLLEDLTHDAVKTFSAFVRTEQAKKLPVTRSNRMTMQALEKWSTWLAEQDIPQTIIRSNRRMGVKDSPKLSPTQLNKTPKRSPKILPLPSPSPNPTVYSKPSEAPDEEVFAMDDERTEPPAFTLDQKRPEISPPWKVRSSPSVKTDLKSIMMAEAESMKSGPSTPPRTKVIGFDGIEGPSEPTPKWSSKLSQRERKRLQGSGSAPEPSPDVIEAPSVPPVRPAGPVWKMPMPSQPQPASPSAPSLARGSPGSSSGLTRAMASNPMPPSSTQPIPERRDPKTPTRPNAPPVQGQSTTPAGPALGPTITPSRSTPGAVRRRVSSDGPGNVWTNPLSTAGPSTLPGTLSFAAIQQQQRDQGLAIPKKGPSLREIQEEEQAHQAEIDFMLWWTAEEARLKAEQIAAAQAASGVPRKGSGRRGKGGKAKSESTKKQAGRPPISEGDGGRRPPGRSG